MKKFILTLLLCIMPLFACGEKKEIREFEQSIEIFEDANVISNYLKAAREEGFQYYSFLDLRAYETELDGYPKTKSYGYGYIDFFDCAPFKDNFDKGLKKYANKPKSYPVIIIDYDGSYIEEAIEYLKGKGYTNIKAFKNGFFDTENNYIDQMGFENLKKIEDCGC